LLCILRDAKGAMQPDAGTTDEIDRAVIGHLPETVFAVLAREPA